jgi:S-adenosylmethionine hydrolase
LKYSETLPYLHTFGEVNKGDALIYTNSLMNLSLAINQGNFATTHHVAYGPEWKITIEK